MEHKLNSNKISPGNGLVTIHSYSVKSTERHEKKKYKNVSLTRTIETASANKSLQKILRRQLNRIRRLVKNGFLKTGTGEHQNAVPQTEVRISFQQTGV